MKYNALCCDIITDEEQCKYRILCCFGCENICQHRCTLDYKDTDDVYDNCPHSFEDIVEITK